VDEIWIHTRRRRTLSEATHSSPIPRCHTRRDKV
jgi:hypothetical protein